MLTLFYVLGVMGLQCMRWMIIKARNYVVMYITLMIVYSVNRYCGTFHGRYHLYKLSTWGVLDYHDVCICMIWLDMDNFVAGTWTDPDDWKPEGYQYDTQFEYTYTAFAIFALGDEENDDTDQELEDANDEYFGPDDDDVPDLFDSSDTD